MSGSRVWCAIVILFALIAAACSGAASESSEVAASFDNESVVSTDAELTTAGPASGPDPVATTEPVATPTAVPAPTPIPISEEIPEFGPTGRPSEAGEVAVLTAKSSVSRPVVFDEPNGKVVPVRYEYLSGAVDETYEWFVNPTYFGNDLVVRVIEGEPGDEWAKVQIPTRPIMEGWIETEHYEWSSSDFYIQVDIATNTVKVWEGDEVFIDTTAVVTGDTGRETPIASTYIDEVFAGPNSAFGPWVMTLGVFSDAINTFGSNAGLPKVALHGTNQPDLLGQHASNGCIRMPNDIIALLADNVPLGTRVDLIDSQAA